MRRSVSEYLVEMREKNLCDGYIEMSRGRLKHFCAWMEDHGVTCLGKMKSEHLSQYMDTYRKNAASYQSYSWNIIRGFLKFHEHPLGRKFRWRAQGRDRQVRWLSEEELDHLLTQPLTPREAFIVCAGSLGMLRRIEVLRLKVSDLQIASKTGRISVWAKGKVRMIPVHPDFKMAIMAYLATLDAKPGESALPISDDHYSRILKQLEIRVGVPCQAHVLRRTGLRMLSKLGVPLPTISAIAGHSNPETTMRYIGAPMDEMTKAINVIPSKFVHS